jgi:protein involved in polysaccharide export with SLBB domain
MLRLLLSFCLLCVCVPSLRAGEAPAQKTFRFRGGESVTILVESKDAPVNTVQNAQQLVTSDGYVSGPAFGTVSLFGKTIPESNEIIREAVTKKIGFMNPQVSILVHSVPDQRTEKRTVYVLGEVKTPKAIELPFEQDYRLAACLAEVGGPTLEADLYRVKVLREKKGVIQAQEVNCARFARTGEENLGPLLEPGDVVIVERAETITVTGEVYKTGVVTRQMANLQPGVPFPLSRALMAAGGIKASGDRTNIKLTRVRPDGQVAFSTCKMVDGRIENDPILESGDVVEVSLGLGITILGGVGSPGIYYELGGHPLTLSRLVALAGGATLKAKTTGVLVVRKGNPGVPVTVNLRAVIEEGKLSDDIRLESGDMVFVPSSTF